MWCHPVTHGTGSEGKTGEWSVQPVLFTLPRNMMYPALLPLMRTPRLPAVDWTDDLNRLIRFARKTNSGICACAITFQTQSTSVLSVSFSRPRIMNWNQQGNEKKQKRSNGKPEFKNSNCSSTQAMNEKLQSQRHYSLEHSKNIQAISHNLKLAGWKSGERQRKREERDMRPVPV